MTFLYVYGVGGVVFLTGILFAWRQGSIGTSSRGLRNLAASLFVLLFFLAVQGYLQGRVVRRSPRPVLRSTFS